jgi:hypothetical protein
MFKINNASVTGNINTLSNLISAINDISNSTGVKASFVSGSTHEFELVAFDGRNITLEFANTETAALLGEEFSVGKQTFAGKIKLRSSKDFRVRPMDLYSHLDLSEFIDLGNGTYLMIREGNGLRDVSLSEQQSAQDSLTNLDTALQEVTARMAAIVH